MYSWIVELISDSLESGTSLGEIELRRTLTLWMLKLCSLLPLVNFVQEICKNMPLQRHPFVIRNALDQGSNFRVDLFLIRVILLPQPHILEDTFYFPFHSCILSPVASVQYRALFRRRSSQRCIDTPRTLAIHDIRANFTDLLRYPCKVEEVILDLEVFADGQQNGSRKIVRMQSTWRAQLGDKTSSRRFCRWR